MLISSLAQQQQILVWAPLLVSIVAVFLNSFWLWRLNARQGKLRAYEPQSFAAMVGGSSVLFLCFPLVLYNTGPKPIIVQDFRLRFPDEPNSFLPLRWRTSWSGLEPQSADESQLPAVFVVSGRSADRHFIEFGGPFPGLTLAAREYQIQIEVKLGHRKDWEPLLDFVLRAEHITNPSDYITYSNAQFYLSKEDKAKQTKPLTELKEQLHLSQNIDGVEI